MMWWFFTLPGGLAPGVDEVIRTSGLILDSDRPGMELDLSTFVAPAPPEGLEVRRVIDESTFRAWAEVVAAASESPEYATSPSVAAFLAHGFSDEAPFRHYVCGLNHRWVGASTLSLGARDMGAGGLSNIAVLPEWRGRGIGSAAASAALLEARGLGLRLGVLSADGPGVRIYQKLRFREACRHLTYIWRPGRAETR